MTVVSDQQRPTGDEPDPQPSTTVGLDLPEVADERRLPSIGVPDVLRRATWRFYLYTPVLLVLVLAAPLLAWKGFSILRNEETGEIIDPTTSNPAEPGYQALVTPTPTSLLADVGPDGSLQGVTLITLPSNDGGGNIVFFPVGTVLPVPLREPPEAALNTIFAESGASGLEQRIETMLGAGIGEFVEVPRSQWANLVGPVAPLTVNNPTAAETTNDAGNPVAFPAGEIQLSAQQVGLYLQADSPEEADPVRIARHQAFWEAWLAALDEAGEDAVPGEGDTGVGGVVRGLIGGPRNLQTIPATIVPVPGVPDIEVDVFRPDTLSIIAQVPQLIPFPTGVGRLRTRLVMGVEGKAEEFGPISHTLVQGGAEIAVIANAQEFGQQPTTKVFYFRDEQREQAQRLVDALGVGELVQDQSQGEQFDVVVVIGDDFFAGGGATGTTLPGQPAGTTPGTVPTGNDIQGGIPSVTPGLPGGETTG